MPAVDGTPAVVTPNGFVVPVIGGEDGSWLVESPCSDEVEVEGQPIEGAHVVIDPGHGGSETGAIGPSGVSEEDVNLDVSLRVKRLLEQRGAVVVLTRSTDVRVTIDVRASLAVALQPLAFVSIHHNAGAVRKQSTPGSEVYHHLDDPASKRLAGLIHEELIAKLAPYGTDWVVGGGSGARARRSLDDGDDFYGILRRSQGVPGVLSESAYLSNPAEERLLDTDAFRESEATAIATGIIRFVTTDDPGSGFIPPLESRSDPGGGGGTGGCQDPPLG